MAKSHGYWSEGKWVETESREEAVYKWREEHGYDPEGVFAIEEKYGGGVVDTRRGDGDDDGGDGRGAPPAYAGQGVPGMPTGMPEMPYSDVFDRAMAEVRGRQVTAGTQPTVRLTGNTVRLPGGTAGGTMPDDFRQPVSTPEMDYQYGRSRGLRRNEATKQAVQDALPPGDLSILAETDFHTLDALTQQVSVQTGLDYQTTMLTMRGIIQEQAITGARSATRPGTAPSPSRSIPTVDAEGNPVMPFSSVRTNITRAAGYTDAALFGSYPIVDEDGNYTGHYGLPGGESFEGAFEINPNTGEATLVNLDKMPILMTPELAYMMWGEGSEEMRIRMGYNPEYPYQLLEKKPPAPSSGYRYTGGGRYRRYGGGGYYGGGGGDNYNYQTPLVMWRIGP